MSELVRTSQKSLKSSSSSLAVTVGTASCQYTRLRCDAALIAHASARKASRFPLGHFLWNIGLERMVVMVYLI